MGDLWNGNVGICDGHRNNVPLGGIVRFHLLPWVLVTFSKTEQWEGRIIGATTVMHSDRAANCR